MSKMSYVKKVSKGLAAVIGVVGVYVAYDFNKHRVIKNQAIAAALRGTCKKLEIETITPGDGVTFPKRGQIAVVNYTGSLLDGTQIDSSRDRDNGKPFEVKVGMDRSSKVIAGFDRGMLKMSLGQRAKFTIPPSLGYPGGMGLIPKQATLVFDIELLAIKDPPSSNVFKDLTEEDW